MQLCFQLVIRILDYSSEWLFFILAIHLQVNVTSALMLEPIHPAEDFVGSMWKIEMTLSEVEV